MLLVSCCRTWAVAQPDKATVSAQDSVTIAWCEIFGLPWEKNQDQEEPEVSATGARSAGATPQDTAGLDTVNLVQIFSE